MYVCMYVCMHVCLAPCLPDSPGACSIGWLRACCLPACHPAYPPVFHSWLLGADKQQNNEININNNKQYNKYAN